MSLGDWRIMRQRVQDSIAIAVRVYSGPGVLPATYNFLVCEFGGFENVLCDAGIYIITSVDGWRGCPHHAIHFKSLQTHKLRNYNTFYIASCTPDPLL